VKIFYVSPSEMPSRSANSIHVIRMCEAIARQGHDLTLFIAHSLSGRSDLMSRIKAYYGVATDAVKIRAFSSRRWPVALNVRIALLALAAYVPRALKGDVPDIVITRNLYAAFLFRYFARERVIYETHELEYGIRKKIQESILHDGGISKVVISKALHDHLVDHHGFEIQKLTVLPDAAPSGIHRLTPEERQLSRSKHFPGVGVGEYACYAGYFGHLYQGRGIEVVQALAERHREILFLVFGGNEAQIRDLVSINTAPNLKIMGHIDPGRVFEFMGVMDVLLMPYQKNVTIGRQKGADTGRYMSPMKMFEYMAAGTPIISSRLPVLQEVLSHEVNCLMADPEDIDEWSACLERLVKDKDLAGKLAAHAYGDYAREYNWDARAMKMLQLIET
jgi:glycosyltransferase involved in cell wall biosynthesis